MCVRARSGAAHTQRVHRRKLHTLEKLPYEPSALEPHFYAADTADHWRLYKKYTDRFNEAVDGRWRAHAGARARARTKSFSVSSETPLGNERICAPSP